MTSVVRNGDKHKVEVLGSLGASEDIQSQIKNEDWNDYKIIAVENRFVHVINGRVTAIVLDEDKEKQVGSGILALQLHAGPPMTVQFRDIKIKKLKPIQIGGVWNMEIFSDQGVGTPVFHLQQQGNQLQGQYEGLLGKSPVKGTVSGDVVEFNISGEYEGQTVTASYRGKMKPNGALAGEVTLNDEMLLNWSATRKN
jgi:hypothetical protein